MSGRAGSAAALSHAPWRRLVLPLALLLAMGIAWGASFSLLHIARLDGAPPFGLAFWEGGGSAALLLLVMLVRRQPLPLDRRSLVFYAISGFLGISLPASLLFLAAKYLPAGVVALSNALVPIVTYGFALLLTIERFAILRAFGLVAGFAGMALVLLPRASLPEPGMAHWALLCFLGSVSYGAQNVYVARAAPSGMSALAMSIGTLAAGGVLLLPVIFATDGFLSMLPPWEAKQWAAAGMLTINAVCTVGFLWLIRSAGPVFTSQTAYLVVLFGILWGIALFGETHSGWIWGALALMLLGVTLVSLRQRTAP